MILAQARLVAAKDLRIEARTRVLTNQVLPFVVIVLVLFGFGLDGNRPVLRTASSGLYWIAVLFAVVLAVQRTFALERADGVSDELSLSGLSGSAIFIGKALAVALELVVVQVVLTAGIIVFYDASIDDPLLFATAALAATVGVAAAATLYGALVAGLRVRDTMLPVLLLPVLAPVLIAATRAFDDALGASAIDGWPWVGLLAVFALMYVAFGLAGFATVLDEGQG